VGDDVGFSEGISLSLGIYVTDVNVGEVGTADEVVLGNIVAGKELVKVGTVVGIAVVGFNVDDRVGFTHDKKLGLLVSGFYLSEGEGIDVVGVLCWAVSDIADGASDGTNG